MTSVVLEGGLEDGRAMMDLLRGLVLDRCDLVASLPSDDRLRARLCVDSIKVLHPA